MEQKWETSCDADACKVLVILGASGAGKSTVAAALGRNLGRSWLQVDDLRLTLQFSGLLKQEPDDAINMFLTPGVWTRPVEGLVDGLIKVAGLLEPALRVVIHSHVVTDAPMILEGDGIHPRLADDPLLQSLVRKGTVRFCCLSTPPQEAILTNMVTRNRGVDGLDHDELTTQAGVYAEFGAWLERESRRSRIPVVPPFPRASLPERILEATWS